MAERTITLRLVVDDAGAVTKLAGVDEALKKTETKASTAATSMNGLAAVIRRYAGPAAMLLAIKSTIDFGDRLDELSQQTGTSVELLQRLGQAAVRSGSSLEAITGAIGLMSDRVAGGDKSANQALTGLGLSFETLRRQDPGSVFLAIAKAIVAVEDPFAIATLSTDLFGRSGRSLIPTMIELAKGGSTVGVMSTQTAKALGVFSDAISDLWTSIRVLVAAIIGPLMPALLGLVKLLVGATNEAFRFFGAIARVLLLKDKIEVFQLMLGRGFQVPVAPTAPQRRVMAAAEPLGAGLDPLVQMEIQHQLERTQERLKAIADQTKLAGERTKEAAEWARWWKFWTVQVGKAIDDLAERATVRLTARTKALGDQIVENAVNLLRFRALLVGLSVPGGPDMPIAIRPPTPARQLVQGPGLFAGFGNFLSQQLPSVLLQAFTGGGNVGRSVGGALGGQLVSGIAKTLSTSASAIGKALGSVLPGIGTLLGGLAGSIFGKIFGPSQAQQTEQMRQQWLKGVGDLDALRKAADLAGFSLDRMLSTKKVKDFQAEQEKLKAALEAHKARVEAIGSAAEGVNLRISGFALSMASVTVATEQTQATFERLGGFVVATFGAAMKETGSFIRALGAVGSGLDQLIALQQKFGFTASATVQSLLDIRKVVTTHQDIAQSISGLTQLMQGLFKSGQVNAEIFKAFGQDAVSLFNEMIRRGVPVRDALFLMQPVLQMLWEHQNKFGKSTDEATRNLIQLATQNGVVGASFREIGERMIEIMSGVKDVLTEIRDLMKGPLVSSADDFTQALEHGRAVAARLREEIANTGFPGGRGGGIPSGGWHEGGVITAHRGLAVDDVLIRAQTGEGILSRRGMANLGRLNRGQTLGGTTLSVSVDARGAIFDSDAAVRRLADRVSDAIAGRLKTGVRLRAD